MKKKNKKESKAFKIRGIIKIQFLEFVSKKL